MVAVPVGQRRWRIAISGGRGGLEEMANGKEIGWKGSVSKRNEGGVGIG